MGVAWGPASRDRMDSPGLITNSGHPVQQGGQTCPSPGTSQDRDCASPAASTVLTGDITEWGHLSSGDYEASCQVGLGH